MSYLQEREALLAANGFLDGSLALVRQVGAPHVKLRSSTQAHTQLIATVANCGLGKDQSIARLRQGRAAADIAFDSTCTLWPEIAAFQAH